MGGNLLCFLDLETTGHDPLKKYDKALIPWHEIIEIGVIIADPLKLNMLGEFEVKVKPDYPERCLPNLINEFTQRAINGEWDNAESLDDAIRQLFDYCRRFNSLLILAGQNFSFDWSFLSVAFALCAINESEWSKLFHYSRLDVRSMAVQEFHNPKTQLNPAEYSLRNNIFSDKLGIPMESYPHKALNGARQSFMVYKKIKELRML